MTAPTSAELGRLTQTLAQSIGRYLERQGLLERDAENSYLAGDGRETGPMEQLLGSSITYRIAVGPRQGRKVFTLHKIAGSNFGRWSEATAAPLQRGEAHGRAEQTLPAWRRGRINGRRSSGCAGTSVGRQLRSSACHSPRMATSVTS